MTIDTSGILAGLKDFQRATVDYAFDRLYGKDLTRHFLVADEVGLGKTLVARGVIAKTVEHLSQRQARINIIYVCSNSDIARQNIKRLRIPGIQDAAHATRATLLATELADMASNPVNLIALTPATSFEHSRGGGRYDERVLLYWLLDGAWSIHGPKASIHVLRNYAGAERFGAEVKNFDAATINTEIKARFIETLAKSVEADRVAGKPNLKQRFEALCRCYARSTSHPSGEESTERDRWIGELRQMLAQACLGALQPDLIILDEFQRFSHLLEDNEETDELARDFFHSRSDLSARFLLLSATPYRALSLHHERNDDHYRDFLKVIGFLENGAPSNLEAILASYRGALPRVMTPEGRSDLRRAISDLEARLRRIIARTERNTLSGMKAMLCEIPATSSSLSEIDVESYLGAQKIADMLEEGDVVEYWKSAPYLFNFMDKYTLKHAFEEQASERELIDLVREHPTCFLDSERLQRYRNIEPANPRLRGLMTDMIERGMWRLLWLPPSLPYYDLEGPFADLKLQNVTKRLVFSAWHMVPRAVASLLSYEAERRMMRASTPRGTVTQDDRAKQRGLLRFNISGGRPSGLPTMLHVFPCLTFAQVCDPRDIARDGQRTATAVRDQLAKNIAALLDRLSIPKVTDGPADERWYWLAPMLLDEASFPQESAAWWGRPDLAQIWSIDQEEKQADQDEEDAGWAKHVDEARQLLKATKAGTVQLGRQPEDLQQVLAIAASAAPATSSLRAIARTIGAKVTDSVELRDAAGRVGRAFLSLFNHPEVIELLRAEMVDDAYWRVALNYAHAGCLQAVLDEYVHLLQEAGDKSDERSEILADDISKAIIDALTIRTANLRVDKIEAPRFTRSIQITTERMRNRFAMRFGDQRSDEDQSATDERGVTRKEHVRAAFNSPFWPFVVVSTSVGQEGLDFHHYCHAVTHWNLPSNPVDLEQREGRVHRYKGHAVRKNVARACGEEALRASSVNVWQNLFNSALIQRPAGRSDLEPYWLFDGDAKIERHVPALPYSRDEERLHDLCGSLTIYRMVLGQSRQEDLIAYLLHTIPEGERDAIVAELQINLSPLSYQ